MREPKLYCSNNALIDIVASPYVEDKSTAWDELMDRIESINDLNWVNEQIKIKGAEFERTDSDA